MCPGRELAIVSMWYEIAVTLHLFDLVFGEENPPSLSEHEFEDGMIW
jgi:hypothetical protein